MRTGCLIYDKEGASINGFFIKRLCEEAEALGLKLSPVTFDGDYSLLDGFDFAISRVRDHRVNAFFEERGIKVFNNSRINFVANDKWETYLLAKRLSVPVMPTRTVTLEELDGLEYPCVLKSRDGHGGKEVFMPYSPKEAREILSTVKKPFIEQKPCDCLGVDTRVYCVGGRIVAAVKREAISGFKSNFSLGGSAKKVEPTKLQEEIIDKLYNELKFDFVGVDFIMDNGEWVLNEIEDPVGSRMLYHSTNLDIAKLFIEHVSLFCI